MDSSALEASYRYDNRYLNRQHRVWSRQVNVVTSVLWQGKRPSSAYLGVLHDRAWETLHDNMDCHFAFRLLFVIWAVGYVYILLDWALSDATPSGLMVMLLDHAILCESPSSDCC